MCNLCDQLIDYGCVMGYKDDLMSRIYDRDADERMRAACNPNLTAEHIDVLLGDSDPIIKCAALRHPSTTVGHLDRAIEDSSPAVQMAVLKHPKATASHVTDGLMSRQWTLRMEAVMSPAANRVQVMTALKDEEPMVRIEAVKKAPEVLAVLALNDTDRNVRFAAKKRLEQLEALDRAAVDTGTPT